MWETDLQNPSFAAFARLCDGVKVTKAEEIEAALIEALVVEGPSLVEIMTDADLV